MNKNYYQNDSIIIAFIHYIIMMIKIILNLLKHIKIIIYVYKMNILYIGITLTISSCFFYICLYYRYKRRQEELIQNRDFNFTNEFNNNDYNIFTNNERINSIDNTRIDTILLNELSILEVDKYKKNKINYDIEQLIQIKKNNNTISFNDAILELISQDIQYNKMLKDNKKIQELYNI